MAIPFENEIQELTNAARIATALLNGSFPAYGITRDYYSVVGNTRQTFSPFSDLGDPGIGEAFKDDISKQAFLQLVSGLVDAHLELYDAATARSTGPDIRDLADLVRIPSLEIIQTGYHCLAYLWVADEKHGLAEFERLVRKGESSKASNDP